MIHTGANDFCTTILQNACKGGNMKIVKLLIQKGAKIGIGD